MSLDSARLVLRETQQLKAELDEREAQARRAAATRPIAGPALMAEQVAALRRFTLRKTKWPELVAVDQRVAEMDERRQEMGRELATLHERLAAAPDEDAQKLTRWQLDGQRGPRPERQAPALEREIAERDADLAAMDKAIAEVLQEKAEFVARHRDRLASDADRAVDAGYERACALTDELERALGELAELRHEAVAVRLAPDELAFQSARPELFAGGLLKPLKDTLGITSQLKVSAVFGALRAHARWARDAATGPQRAALEGRNPRDKGAVWDQSREAEELAKQERQKVQERIAAAQRPGSRWGD